MTTLEELQQEQQSQANFLEALAASLRSVVEAKDWAALEARLADDTPLRFGSYPAGAATVAAGTSEPGATSIIADGAVTLPAFGPTTRPVVIVTALPSLPNTLYPVGSTAVVEGTGVLYRNVAGVWTATVGAIAGGIAVLGALPALPDAAYPTGSLVYLTTDEKLYRNASGTWSKAVDGGDITAGSILADSIGAGQITAGKFAATILLASTIRTAETGNIRVELSSGGIVLFDASDTPLVVLPTNGDPVFVKGAIEAASLISNASAEFRGEAALAQAAVMTLEAGIVKPTAAPVIAQSTAGSFSIDPQPGDDLDKGMAWDPASSTWYMGYYTGGDVAAIREFNGTTGATVRVVATALDVSDLVKGIGVSATHVYLAVANTGGSTLKLYKYLRSDLSLVTSATITADVAVYNQAVLFYDATADRLVVVTATGTGATKQVRFRLYNQSLALQSTIDATGLTINGTTTVMTGGVRAEGFYWIAMTLDGTTKAVRCFNLTTGAYVSDQDWGLVGTVYYAASGLGHDGTSFFARSDGSPSREIVSRFTNWNWTTASAKYWVAYSWYDSAGTTHETQVGPRASITMYRRMRLQVTTAAIPGSGGADEPDRVRYYMAPNATEPAAGSYKLQLTSILTSWYFSTYDSGGAADPTTNDFPGGSPAELKSAAAGWSLLGSGLMNFGGTTFPASPATNDQFYRTDLGLWFFYDGTRWLSVQLFTSQLRWITTGGEAPFSVTTTAGHRMPGPSLQGGSDIWLVGHNLRFIVSGGTALGVSHKWVGTVLKVKSDTTTTTAATVNIDSGASSVYRLIDTAIGALLNNGTTHYVLWTTWTKTGTPGTLTAYEELTYRIVAT